MFSKDTANMIEKLRLRTKTNITSATRGLVPYVQDITDYDIPYDINPLYLYNNNRIVDREHTIIKGNIVSYKRYTVNHKTDNIFRMGLMEAISRDLVYPILIFINGEFIKWSEITVVKDYKYNTILLDNKKKYNRESIDRIQVITLPFNVKYTENKKKFKNWTMLFRFDNNGRLNEVGDIVIYVKHPNLVYKPLVFWTPEVYNYDTGIPSNIVMDKVNIIPFKNGLLHTDMNYNINNMNILSITEEGEITSGIECKLFYRTEVPHAVDHITNIPNQKSLRKQIKEGTLDPDVNMSIIKDRFDFQYDTLMKYDDNITNAMEYISLYNSNLLNSEYLNKTKVFTKRITGKEIKTMLNPFGYLTMIRIKYGVRDTYVMVFKNGELYDQYSEIKYTLNYFTLPIGDCDDRDEFEFVYFLDVNNFYLHNSVLQPGNAAISEYPIEEENLLVYSNDPNAFLNGCNENLMPLVHNKKEGYTLNYNYFLDIPLNEAITDIYNDFVITDNKKIYQYHKDTAQRNVVVDNLDKLHFFEKYTLKFVTTKDGYVYKYTYMDYLDTSFSDETGHKITDEELFDMGLRTFNNKMMKLDIDNVKDIYYDRYNTFVIKNDNTLWGTNNNVYGIYNDEEFINEYVFHKIEEDVKQVVCCEKDTYILKNDGTLITCNRRPEKDEFEGLMMLDDTDNLFTKLKIDNIKEIYTTDIGSSTHFILKNNGKVYMTKNIKDISSHILIGVITGSISDVIIKRGYKYLLTDNGYLYKLEDKLIKIYENIKKIIFFHGNFNDYLYILNNDSKLIRIICDTMEIDYEKDNIKDIMLHRNVYVLDNNDRLFWRYNRDDSIREDEYTDNVKKVINEHHILKNDNGLYRLLELNKDRTLMDMEYDYVWEKLHPGVNKTLIEEKYGYLPSAPSIIPSDEIVIDRKMHQCYYVILFLTTKGNVYVIGSQASVYNTQCINGEMYDAIINGDNYNHTYFLRLNLVSDVKAIYPSTEQFMYIDYDGNTWGHGINLWGGLGIYLTDNFYKFKGNFVYHIRNHFERIRLNDVDDIYCLGRDHKIFKLKDNTYWWSGSGDPIDPDPYDQICPPEYEGQDPTGGLYNFINKYDKPTKIPFPEFDDVKRIVLPSEGEREYVSDNFWIVKNNGEVIYFKWNWSSGEFILLPMEIPNLIAVYDDRLFYTEDKEWYLYDKNTNTFTKSKHSGKEIDYIWWRDWGYFYGVINKRIYKIEPDGADFNLYDNYNDDSWTYSFGNYSLSLIKNPIFCYFSSTIYDDIIITENGDVYLKTYEYPNWGFTLWFNIYGNYDLHRADVEEHIIHTTDRSRYDVPFHIDNGQIMLDDSYYYNKPVDLVSKHQFKYCFRNAVIEMCDIRLTPDFIGCLDPNRYLVFVNGRLLHRRFYKILIEKKDNSFLEPWVYTKKYLHKGDKIEVFYLPYDFNYTKYANNVKVEVASLTSEGDKRTFVIPFPFTNYADDPENTFSVFYGSTFISPQRYSVRNNSITFDFDILAGRKVSFVFIYSKSEEVSDIKYLKENSHIITETAYSVATEENQKKFFIPVPFMGYIDAGNYFFITYRGLFLNKDRFTIHYDNVTTQYYVMLDDNIHVTKDSAIVFVFTYTIDNNVAMENYILEATENNQTEFKIDKDKFQYMLEGIAGYYLILNGTYVSEELYKLNPSTGCLSLTNPLNKGERLSLTVLYSATTYVKDVYVQLEATENNQTVFNLPSVFLKYKKKDNKFLVIIGSVLEDPRSYKIEGNKLILTDGVAKGNSVGLLILYVDKSKKSIMNSISSNKYFRQESIPVQIEEEGQYTFKIPYEYTFKRNYLTFFITIGSVMLDDSRYEVDMVEGTVTILNTDDQVLISKYRQVEFTFVYSDMIVLEKDVRYITINSTNDLYFNLPFENFLTLGNKMLVFIGSTFVEPDRYTITGDYKTERRIHFEEDLKEDDFGRNIMIIYYYATNEDNISLLNDDVSITKLPSSGYIYLSKDDINYAMNKDLYFLFVNGKKVAKKDIIDISANIIRVEKDPQSLYNVQILDYTPKIDEIHQYFEGQFSDYDSQMNLLKANTLDMLFGVYSFMSDTEPMVAPDISESNIIRQINKDFYVVNGNTFNDTFPYNFETETVREFNMLKDNKYHMSTDYRGNLLIDSTDGDVYEIVDGPKSMDKEYNE